MEDEVDVTEERVLSSRTVPLLISGNAAQPLGSVRGTRDHSKACLDRIVQQIEDDTTSVGTQWKERLRDEARRMRQHGAHEGKVQS